MEHFTAGQWIDFVNELISTDLVHVMRKHLDEGCKRCSQTVSLWERVRNSAREQKHYQPPPEALRKAQAAFSSFDVAFRRKRAYTLAEMLFDSLLQPSFAGARSVQGNARQMLYRAEPFQIDVQIEAAPDRNSLIVTGQLLDLRQPGFAGKNTPVVVSYLRGKVVQTATNELGEFRKEIPESENLELVFPGLADKPIIISVRDPLGRRKWGSHGAASVGSERRGGRWI